jgi:hypothetical protein
MEFPGTQKNSNMHRIGDQTKQKRPGVLQRVESDFRLLR